MTRITACFIALMLALPPALAGGPAPFGPPPGATINVAKLASIEPFVNAEVAKGNIPGACVLVQQDGKRLYLKCFGRRDPDAGPPLTEDAIFPIHSVTKTITSVAALMLADAGKIALNDPVSAPTRWPSDPARWFWKNDI